MEKKLLVISYVFPPDKGIGGRRWWKFAKSLTKNGVKVFVITATPDEHLTFSAGNDNGIEIHRIKSSYPAILRFMGKMNLWHKIEYRLMKRRLLLTTKGNIYDTSVGWDKNLIPSITDLIKKEGIKNIVVTAPPYRHMHYVTKLKHIYPDLNILLDFRDPWTELDSFTSMFHMEPARLTAEKEIEKETLALADYVIAVSDGRTKLFEGLVSPNTGLVTITNGVDPDDYSFLSTEPASTNEYFSIVHSGTLNPGYIKYIQALVAFINKNKEALITAKVKFEFCGYANNEMTTLLKKAPPEIVINHGLLPQKDAIRILNSASVGLILLKEGYESMNFFTKLYEYMALKKKMIFIGSPKAQSLSDLLTKENIGVTFYPEKFEALLDFLLNREKYNSLSYHKFDLSPYEIDNLSKKIETLLK